MKYLLLFVIGIVSCQVSKPSIYATKLVVNYQGPQDRPVSPLIFTTEYQYSAESDGPYAYVVVVDKNEFSMLRKAVETFKNVASPTDYPSDIESFEILVTDSCKQKSYGTYGRNNSMNFLYSLIKTSGKFRPEVRDSAEIVIKIIQNRL